MNQFLILLLFSAMLSADNGEHVWTPCEVIAKIDQVRGAVITVRGELLCTNEGTVMTDLRDRSCELPEARAMWPLNISLEDTGSPFVDDPPPGFVTEDPKGSQEVAAAYKRSPVGRVVADVVGEIRSRPGVKPVVGPNGVVVQKGYGNSMNCPVQLVVKRVVRAKPLFVRRPRKKNSP